ncbi:MAG: gephyrin-like molybdotransferase Glp [Pseudomonadota bacterium]
MLSVEEALQTILADAVTLEGEAMPLDAVDGRVAARDHAARITQPPFAASAMDGYAVRFEDAVKGAMLNVIGEAPAGAPFGGSVGVCEAVRIFTGAPTPDGATHVVIQEDVTRDGDVVVVNAEQQSPRNIRAAGIDFQKGDTLIKKGERLHEMHGALLAAANIKEASVVRAPRLAVFSNGDELRDPGDVLAPGEIVNSNHYAVSAMARQWGAAPTYLGCAADTEAAVAAMFENARGSDIIVPIGGASVGDYDFVKSAFRAVGGDILFEKVAVRPGKPTWFGRLGGARVIGLPGNPASAIVTAALFVQPLARRMSGHETAASRPARARLVVDTGANGPRESYLRASAEDDGDVLSVTPAPNQDSALLSPFASANALIRRAPNAPAAVAGDEVDIVWLR